CVHHRVTGRTNLLTIAAKAAGFLSESTREPLPEAIRAAVCPSHYMGLVELWRETGDRHYLELGMKLFSLRGRDAGGTDDNQDRLPFEEQTNAVGHAVRANYLYAGAADFFLETGDVALWRPLPPLWTNVVLEKMYVTGGCGALYDGASPDGAKDQKSISRVHQAYGREYQLPNLTAHSETCANIGNVVWNWRMFLATGEAKFMDVVELALYNSVLSGMDLSGTNFCYVNPLRSLAPAPVDLRWPHRRVPFLSSFCCPPNLARTIAEVNGLAFARSTGAIWVNLYGAGTLETDLSPGHRVILQQETDYPWNGRIMLTVKQCNGDPFALNLRIPGWAPAAALRLNGSHTDLALSPGTYVELRRRWVPGDRVELDLPMPAVLLQANPRVEETLNQVAVRRGPLVYCLETADLPAQLKPGNPAASAAGRITGGDRDVSILNVVVPADADLVARFDRNFLGGVVVIDATGSVSKPSSWTNQLYRELQRASPALTTLHFIPYLAWGNRSPGDMSVWLPLAPARVKN
ncbi:MAG TPA: beta-L-arabinofuranosidase domain-containing protein, partial [Methylomirabilota bacterium]|nr:beta-L-arabinofuranosidase domain-containing protein [Methylomirabilota bacterium]